MKKIYLWLPVIFWMILIFFLSSQTSVRISQNKILEFLIFKTLHLLEYGVLFLLIYRATEKNLALSFILTLLYAIFDEIHQLFVPTRGGRIGDVLIDSLGAFLASLVVEKNDHQFSL